MKVYNFIYNGFCGRLTGGIAPYTAKFSEWTGDPGVMRCACSDGRKRLIPTFALELGKNEKPYPEQPEIKVWEDGKCVNPAAAFGPPSRS